MPPQPRPKKMPMSVHFGEQSYRWLRQRADELGISMSELVRRTVDDRRVAEAQPRRATR
jgi:hypothetical protein